MQLHLYEMTREIYDWVMRLATVYCWYWNRLLREQICALGWGGDWVGDHRPLKGIDKPS